MITIKRYRNRRLYHTGIKAFIVLSDVERIVRQGNEFVVIDTESGKDITLSILTAVINDRAETWKHTAAARDTLQAVIRLGGQTSMSILKNTVLAGIGFAELTKKKAEQLIDSLIKSGELSKSEKKEAVLELLGKAETSAKGAKDRITKEVEKTFKNLKMARKNDIDSLSRKVDRLNKKISDLQKNLEEKAKADD